MSHDNHMQATWRESDRHGSIQKQAQGLGSGNETKTGQAEPRENRAL